MPNWFDINKCPIWKVLGVTECNNCDTVDKCWGDEVYCTVECGVCPFPCNKRGTPPKVLKTAENIEYKAAFCGEPPTGFILGALCCDKCGRSVARGFNEA